MYTGGVSSLAEQIASQLQRREQPKALLDQKGRVSVQPDKPVRPVTRQRSAPLCAPRSPLRGVSVWGISGTLYAKAPRVSEVVVGERRGPGSPEDHTDTSRALGVTFQNSPSK